MGIKISVDDFGTGYSSLSYLNRLPINRVKIDKSFIFNLGNSEDDAVLTKSIITMANLLKLQVVAEGVETEKQANLLFRYGCHEVQGYYFAKPMSLTEYESFLSNQRLATYKAAEKKILSDCHIPDYRFCNNISLANQDGALPNNIKVKFDIGYISFVFDGLYQMVTPKQNLKIYAPIIFHGGYRILKKQTIAIQVFALILSKIQKVVP